MKTNDRVTNPNQIMLIEWEISDIIRSIASISRKYTQESKAARGARRRKEDHRFMLGGLFSLLSGDKWSKQLQKMFNRGELIPLCQSIIRSEATPDFTKFKIWDFDEWLSLTFGYRKTFFYDAMTAWHIKYVALADCSAEHLPSSLTQLKPLFTVKSDSMRKKIWLESVKRAAETYKEKAVPSARIIAQVRDEMLGVEPKPDAMRQSINRIRKSISRWSKSAFLDFLSSLPKIQQQWAVEQFAAK